MNWEAISSISTLVGTAVVVITAVFAILQLNEMKRSRRLELVIKLFEELSSIEAREHRLFIYSKIPDDPSELTSEHFLKIDDVLSKMDVTWILINQNMIDKTYIFDAYGEIFLRLWKKLYPIVIYERSRRGDYYRQKTEILIAQIQRYFQKKGRSIEYRVYDVSSKNSGIQNSILDKATASQTVFHNNRDNPVRQRVLKNKSK